MEKKDIPTGKSKHFCLLSDALTAFPEESVAFHRVVAKERAGSATWRKPRPQNVGSPKSRPLVLGRALLKPAWCGPCRVKASDQTAIETVFSEGSAISAAYIKYFYSKVFSFFF